MNDFWYEISNIIELCYDVLDKAARVGEILERAGATKEEVTQFIIAVLVGTYINDPKFFDEIVTISKTLALNLLKKAGEARCSGPQ